MDFLKLQINNFLTIGEGSIDLSGRGLLLVQGENKDNSSANSNGAGKSSIVDALCWCLYGTTARGITGDTVVNKTAKKNCAVTVLLDDNGNLYKVIRHRKHATHKNALQVFSIDSHANETGNLTKGTDKETQEFLTGLIGSTLDVFMSSVYAGQEMMPNLPALTDKNLKVLIEEASGIQVLEEAHTIAKKRLATIKSEHQNKQLQLSNSLTLQTSLEGQLAHAQARLSEFDSTKKDRAKAKLAETLPYQREVTRITAEIAQLEQADLDNRYLVAKSNVENLENIQVEAKRLERLCNDLGVGLRTININTTSLKATINNLAVEIKGIDALVGTPCKECGKDYCAGDLETARAARLSQGLKIKQDYIARKNEAADAEAQFNKAEQDYKNFIANNPLDARAAYDELRKIEITQQSRKGWLEAIQRYQGSIEAVKSEAKAIMLEANPFTTMVQDLATQHGSVVASVAQLTAEAEALEEKVKLHEHAVMIYGPSGVRAHILDTVTPFLNDRTAEYLGALSDGNTEAVWSTLTKNAKGNEYKEKFSISVRDETGAECFAGLSGGEKRKVRLATALALQDLVASRATKPISLFIGDEIDDALDASGLERLMGVLERKARDRGTVLVVSHSELRDWIDNVVLVTKENGYSTLSGANHH